MGLFNLFNTIPATYKVESRKEQLIKQHNFYKEFLASEKYSRFSQLNELVLSEEFKLRKAEIENQKFSDTEEAERFNRYNDLKKDSSISSYFAFKASKDLKTVTRIEESGIAENYNELWKIVDSQEFIQASKQDDFQDTDFFIIKQKFDKIKNSADFKAYTRISESAEYSNYLEINDSDVLAEFLELEKFIHSEGFINFKALLSGSKKRKFLNSEEFKLLQEHKKLLRDNDIIALKKLNKSNNFQEIEKWEVTFEDDFNASNVDNEKWSDKYYWGEEVINKGYSIEGDLHAYKSSNVSVANNLLKITTKRESADGLIWNPKFGFVPKKFDYTSGLINTSRSFRQKYGKFEAKIKISNPNAINQAFWMVAEKNAPHINILNACKGKIEMGMITKNNEQVINDAYKANAGKFANKFFIFTFEWTPEKLTWYINDKEVKSITSNIPTEPMYIAFSAGITKDNNIGTSSMEIDWVRSYSLKEMN